MKIKLLAALTCAVGLAGFPVAAAALLNLSFGVYTSNKPTAMVKKFRPMLNAIEKDLSQRLGERIKIRIQVAKDYTQGINHLATGKIDFSRFGPASYVEAKRTNPDLKILALESTEGEKVFYGIICVAKDSPITDVQQLAGKSFAFGDEMSTIGRYLSQKYLVSHGIRSASLRRFAYLERHDKVGTAVGSGQYDAGALNEGTFNKLVAKGVPIRELARFPNVQKPWIARSGLSNNLYEVIRDTLLEMTNKKALRSLKKDGFVPGGDEDFASIRDAIDNNSVFFLRNIPEEEIAAEIITPEPAKNPIDVVQAIPSVSAEQEVAVIDKGGEATSTARTKEAAEEVSQRAVAEGSKMEIVRPKNFTPLDSDPHVLDFLQNSDLSQLDADDSNARPNEQLSASISESSLPLK